MKTVILIFVAVMTKQLSAQSVSGFYANQPSMVNSSGYYSNNFPDHYQNEKYRYSGSSAVFVATTASSFQNYVVTFNTREVYLIRNNNNSLVLNNLSHGNHYVTIESVRTNLWGQQKRSLVYSGNVNLRQGFETRVDISLTDRVTINNTQLYVNTQRPSYDNNRGSGNGRGRNRGRGNSCGNNGW